MPTLETALIEYFNPPLNRQIIVYLTDEGKDGKKRSVVRSIRIPDDVEAKILEVQESEPEKSINSIMVDAIRIGLDCPEEAELVDRVKNLEQRVDDIESRINS